jgi:N-acetylated-alpha-linked acidic dipeptidase
MAETCGPDHLDPSRLPFPRLLALLLLAGPLLQPACAQSASQPAPVPDSSQTRVFGFRDFTQQAAWDRKFLAVPDRALASQHLKALTAAPHWASSPEDYATALYVAARFKEAGLETQIVPFSVLLDKPESLSIEAFDAAGTKILAGPTREHVDASANPDVDRSQIDSSQTDPRILPGFNSSSSSGDVTAPVVYVNYGRLADFKRLADLGIAIKGKIALVRYGGDFRGVKVYIAQRYGAAGVLIYSDPSDGGFKEGTPYPEGPWRPDSAVQRGSVQFMPIYPGDPTTPGVASTPGLPAAERIPLDKLQYDLPGIPVIPLSSADAAPILRALQGQPAPRDWQGSLPFAYHLGASPAAASSNAPSNTSPSNPVTVHLHLTQDARLRTIWDVIGRIPGVAEPNQWVVAGNHRDAWVYGAADPGSGTAAMLEAVHGLGALLHQGWKPHRTIVVASWDAEEEGLIGSTEWVEQHLTRQPSPSAAHIVAYLNVDVAVSGPVFNAAAVPSLRQFLREIAREVPSPAGGTVLQQWKKDEQEGLARRIPASVAASSSDSSNPQVGDLGSGSDYTPFLQHAGVPATDIGSDGPFGVYHTAYDDYDWFVRFADPAFAYTQQQARIFGLEMLHMADADVLPFDYEVYAEQIRGYLTQARARSISRGLKLEFTAAFAAAGNFADAARTSRDRQLAPPANASALDLALSSAERALLIPAGLPRRPWYRHSIYAPGEFTGYAAVVLPGVNEAIDLLDAPGAQTQLNLLAQALDRAAAALTPSR